MRMLICFCIVNDDFDLEKNDSDDDSVSNSNEAWIDNDKNVVNSQ